MTRANKDIDARMLSLMTAAREIFGQICPGNDPQVLLHGDLHHDNMLRNQAGEWKAIDPQGVIGAPFMESARFIQNHVIDEKGLSLEVLDETVTYFAGLWALPKRIISSAVVVLHALSTCWGYQMAYTPEMLTRQVDEIEKLLRYVKSV
jgi:streptomycin 6-kinase